MTPISKKIASRIWGYAKRKEIKDAYPKKVCHMPRHDKKKKKIKEAYPKKVCHMLRHVKKDREKRYPLSKRKKERWFILRSSYTIHQKYPHTCTY